MKKNSIVGKMLDRVDIKNQLGDLSEQDLKLIGQYLNDVPQSFTKRESFSYDGPQYTPDKIRMAAAFRKQYKP